MPFYLTAGHCVLPAYFPFISISQINKNADNLTIICTCVFSTMACCCIDNTTDESKVTETVMKFSKEFEKTIDMLDEIAHDVDTKYDQK